MSMKRLIWRASSWRNFENMEEVKQREVERGGRTDAIEIQAGRSKRGSSEPPEMYRTQDVI
jgi:hypothetical protein